MAEPVHAAIKRLGLRLRVYGPGRRAGAGHGVPRAPPAREHLERELRAPPLRRGPGPRRAGRAAGRRRAPRPDRGRPSVPPTDPSAPDALRARAAAGVAARIGPSRLQRGDRQGARRHRASRCRRSSTASGCAPPTTITSVDPAQIDRVVATSASCTAADADRAVAAAVAAAPGLARDAGRSSAPRCCSAPRSGCASAATSWPPSSASRRPSRGTRPTPTCARRSTSASTTAARCCASTPRGPTSCSRRPARRTGSPTRARASPR